MKVKQDPEYLKNQSRYLHARYRRNARFSKGFLCVWSIVLSVVLLASLLDVLLDFGWGFQWRDVGGIALFLLFGALYYGFFCLTQEAVLGMTRRMYGPDPGPEDKP